jgi:hypothetical protein
VTASHSLAAGVTLSVRRRSASRFDSLSICRSTICVSSSVARVEEDHVVEPVQEPGLNVDRPLMTASFAASSSDGSAMKADPRFEVG